MTDYVFHLYIYGSNALGKRATSNLNLIIENDLASSVTLEIIDVKLDPEAAEQHRVLATPTLIKTRPLPTRRIVGDLSDRSAVLEALGVISENHWHE